MGLPYYRLPDGGLSPIPGRIKAPSVPKPRVLRKPKGLYTKGSVTSQGIKLSAPKPRTPVRTASPTIKMPASRSNNISIPTGGMSISLPGFTSAGDIVSFYRRTPAQLKSMASQAVHLELDPQIHTLEHGYNVENQNYGYLINNLRKQLGLSKGDIKTLYDGLDVALAVNARAQDKINTDTKASMDKIYNDLNTQLNTTYNTARGNVTSELARLGISAPTADDQLISNQAGATGQAATAKANAGALLGAINASGQGLLSGLRSNSAGTGAMLQGQLQMQFDKESADALQGHLQKLADIVSQKKMLTASLPSKINQTYQALLDQQYQREMDAAQKLFDNQIKLGNYQQSIQNAQSTAAYHQNQLALAAQRLALDTAKSKVAPNAKLTGSDKALDYLRRVSAASHVPYNQLQNILIDAINGDPNRPTDMPGYNKNFQSGYASDINNMVKSAGYPQLYTDLVRAMQYWFGG